MAIHFLPTFDITIFSARVLMLFTLVLTGEHLKFSCNHSILTQFINKVPNHFRHVHTNFQYQCFKHPFNKRVDSNSKQENSFLCAIHFENQIINKVHNHF